MMRRQFRLGQMALAACAWMVASAAVADVRLPRVFGDHMVVQRDVALPIWGWADAGEAVTVRLGTGPVAKTVADANGQWRVDLSPAPAGGPHTLAVEGGNKLAVQDVYVGEVWLCSGQSNMAWTVRQSLNPQQEAAAADWPQIRSVTIPRVPASRPTEDVQADWQVCSPDTASSFSACAYYFGRHLHRELGVPVGLINSSWGGTRIEPWTPPVGFAAVPALAGIHEQIQLANPKSDVYKSRLGAYLTALGEWMSTARKGLAAETLLPAVPAYPQELRPMTHHQQPTTLYNGMVNALVPFGIRGAIWYQGESNHAEGALYTEKMRALISGWRSVWEQPDMPFYFVQIAPYKYGNENPHILPVFWEAQAATLAVPNTGMVVTNDIGNVNDIHPKNKQEVGRRLALIALANAYGRDGVVCSGPVYKSMAAEDARLRLLFDHVGAGLTSRDGKPLSGFEIIGRDTDFVKANAVIDGESVLLSHPEVKHPMAVRFGWHKLAEPNLANAAGLPARPFRAGDVPQRDYLRLHVPEANSYTLLYDLDLRNIGREVTYTVNNAKQVTTGFDRVAYFLELKKTGAAIQYVYVSMDSFTDDVTKVGVPTIGSKARFQCKVRNMNVVSNVEGITTGTGLTGGNIEFWSSNYAPGNSGNVPNASGDLWDFGDQPTDPVDGYGSMQIHNHEAKQTLLAFCNWKARDNADLGIGNSTGRTRDWTFMKNAGSYEVRRLRVLVRPRR